MKQSIALLSAAGLLAALLFSTTAAAQAPPGNMAELWAIVQQQQAIRVILTERGDAKIPRPPHWGGFTLCADVIELWKSRPARIHDRAEWRRSDASANGDQAWRVARLQP